MKSLHFCTQKKLQEIHQNEIFDSIRTGWIPQLFTGDMIRIDHRKTLKAPYIDTEICHATVLSVEPIQFKKICNDLRHAEEIERYNKKFHPEQYFFLITCKKQKK